MHFASDLREDNEFCRAYHFSFVSLSLSLAPFLPLVSLSLSGRPLSRELRSTGKNLNRERVSLSLLGLSIHTRPLQRVNEKCGRSAGVRRSLYRVVQRTVRESKKKERGSSFSWRNDRIDFTLLLHVRFKNFPQILLAVLISPFFAFLPSSSYSWKQSARKSKDTCIDVMRARVIVRW